MEELKTIAFEANSHAIWAFLGYLLVITFIGIYAARFSQLQSF